MLRRMGTQNFEYEPQRLPAVGKEARFIWEEKPEGITVRFPPPISEDGSRGCAIAILVFAWMLFGLAGMVLGWQLLENPGNIAVWIATGVGAAFAGLLIRYLAADARKVRVPSEPSVLTIGDGILKIERTGHKRDVDVSWEVSEIADIRVCPTTDERIFLGVGSMLSVALFPPGGGLIRISVMRPSGEVDDVVFQSPGKDWADEAEKKLRDYLGLTSNKTP